MISTVMYSGIKYALCMCVCVYISLSTPFALSLLSNHPPPASVNSWTASWLNINNSHQLSLMTHYNPSNGEGGKGRWAFTDDKMKACIHTQTHRFTKGIIQKKKFSFSPVSKLNLKTCTEPQTNANIHLHSHIIIAYLNQLRLGCRCEGHGTVKWRKTQNWLEQNY